MSNQVQLSVYPDCIGDNLADLNAFLKDKVDGKWCRVLCCAVLLLPCPGWQAVAGRWCSRRRSQLTCKTAAPCTTTIGQRQQCPVAHGCLAAAAGAMGSIHLLPLYPSTGDRGFAPVTYQQVNPEFGECCHQRSIYSCLDGMSVYMICMYKEADTAVLGSRYSVTHAALELPSLALRGALQWLHTAASVSAVRSSQAALV